MADLTPQEQAAVTYWQQHGRTVQFVVPPLWYADATTLAQVAAASGKADGVPTRAASEAHGIPQPDDWIGDRPHYIGTVPSTGPVWVYPDGSNAPLPPYSNVGGGSLMVYSSTPSGAVTGTAAQTTAATPVTVTPQTSLPAAIANAKAQLQAAVKSEILILLQALTPASTAYTSAYAALQSAIQSTVDSELARLSAITDPAQIASQEQAAEQHIDSVAQQAYQQWLATTSGHPSIAGAVDQAQVVAQAGSAAQSSGVSGGATATFPSATSATLDMATIPQSDPNSVLSWFAGIRQKFLAAPGELTQDLQQIADLENMVPDVGSITGVGAIQQTIQALQGEWANDAVSFQQVSDALDSGSAGAAVVVQIIGLSAVIAAFFAKKATAESALDSIGKDALTTEQYAQWTKHPATTGVSGKTILVVAGLAVLYFGFFSRRSHA